MRPWSAGTIPATLSSKVVLPAPFGPISPRTSPRCRSKLTSCRANCPPNVFVSPSTQKNGSLRSPMGDGVTVRSPVPSCNLSRCKIVDDADRGAGPQHRDHVDLEAEHRNERAERQHKRCDVDRG